MKYKMGDNRFRCEFFASYPDQVLVVHISPRGIRQRAKRLPPLQIGKSGQLKEWVEDYPEAESQHRHVCICIRFTRGHDIALKGTPDLAAVREIKNQLD
jgi:alpha-L-fucosidase 2